MHDRVPRRQHLRGLHRRTRRRGHGARGRDRAARRRPRGRQLGGRGPGRGAHGALDDHGLGLLERLRRHPQLGVDELRDHRDARGAAHQEDAHQVGRVHPRGADGLLEAVDGALQGRAGDVLELRPRQVRVDLERGQVDVGARGARERLLGAADVLVEHAAVAAVAVVGGVEQPPPVLGVRGAVGLAEVLDDAVVEVEAADVAEALLGEHFEAGLGAAHHGRVEGAAAEVVDRQAAPGRDGGAEHGGEVGGRGHRLGDELGGGQSGQAGRVDQDRAAALAPPRGVRQADLAGHLAGLALGLEGDLLEDVGEHLGHRDL